MHAKSVVMTAVLLFSTAASAVDSFHGLGGVSFGGTLSNAYEVSGNGAVIVGIRGNGVGFEAVRWAATGVFFALGDLPGGGSFAVANDVSLNGRLIVGQSDSANGSEAYRWSRNTGMVGLGDLPGPGLFASRALATSANGLVVVGLSQR